MYLFSWLHLLRGPRNHNKTAEKVKTPSTKILVSKFHSPPKGCRFFLRRQGLDMRKKKKKNKNMSNYFVELESKEVLRK